VDVERLLIVRQKLAYLRRFPQFKAAEVSRI